LKLIKTVFFLPKVVANMNPEDHMETSNAAKVGDNGTGHCGFGNHFGVLMSAIEVAASGQVGPHDLAAPLLCWMPCCSRYSCPSGSPSGC